MRDPIWYKLGVVLFSIAAQYYGLFKKDYHAAIFFVLMAILNALLWKLK